MGIVEMTIDIDEGQGLTDIGITYRTVPKSFAERKREKVPIQAEGVQFSQQINLMIPLHLRALM